MKTKLSIGLGLVTGFIAAILLWSFFERLWIGYVIGAPLALVGGLMMLRDRKRNKIVSCFLASTVAVSPNILAEDFSAGFSGQQCYCFTPAAETPEPEQHAVVLSFIIEDGEPRILGLRHPTELVDYAALNESLAPWGINLDGPVQYAKNGLPASAADVPFAFGEWSALTIYPAREQFSVVVETAAELGAGFTFWQPVARFSVPAGVRVEVQDSPEGTQSFYRVRLERAPEAFQPQGAILLGCGLGLLVGTGIIGVLAVRQCAKNKKKFEKMLPPKKTNDMAQAQSPE